LILLDLSRLVSRAGRETPTGIDRVELAYAKHLIGNSGFLHFTIMTPLGRLSLVPGNCRKTPRSADRAVGHKLNIGSSLGRLEHP
jgi:hypothetical protein